MGNSYVGSEQDQYIWFIHCLNIWTCGGYLGGDSTETCMHACLLIGSRHWGFKRSNSASRSSRRCKAQGGRWTAVFLFQQGRRERVATLNAKWKHVPESCIMDDKRLWAPLEAEGWEDDPNRVSTELTHALRGLEEPIGRLKAMIRSTCGHRKDCIGRVSCIAWHSSSPEYGCPFVDPVESAPCAVQMRAVIGERKHPEISVKGVVWWRRGPGGRSCLHYDGIHEEGVFTANSSTVDTAVRPSSSSR